MIRPRIQRQRFQLVLDDLIDAMRPYIVRTNKKEPPGLARLIAPAHGWDDLLVGAAPV